MNLMLLKARASVVASMLWVMLKRYVKSPISWPVLAGISAMICFWTIVSLVVMLLAGVPLLAASLGAFFVGTTTTALVAATIVRNLLAAHMTDDDLGAFFVRTIRAGDKVDRS